jgi:polyribonucleotide nucleotidyltransferase
MDFKVAGTVSGVTAIQLDVKVTSISFDMIRDALAQAREARQFILDHLRETISETRAELSPYAPRMIKITIPVEKIGIVIGPGGKTIRAIIEETKATVDIQDDGTVMIGGSDEEAAGKAIKKIEDLTREVNAGDIYTGKVVRLMDFGAFVEILPGRDGLVHISELADYHVRSVEDEVSVGDEITVMVTEIDNLGRVNLSRRALLSGDGSSDDGDGRDVPVTARNQQDRGGFRSGPPRGRGRPGGDRGGYRQGPRRDGGRRPDSRPPGPRPPRDS